MYKLVEITDRARIDFTREQNSVAWKGRLSLQDYQIRDFVLAKAALVAQNSMKIYILEEDGLPVASVEILIRDGTRYSFEGEVKKDIVKYGCIGGVYTYEGYRRRGIAKIMVDQLMTVAKEQVGESGFTVLYSEVGEYYQRSGFESMRVDVVNIPLDYDIESKSANFDPEPLEEGVSSELVGYHEFEALFETLKMRDDSELVARVKQDRKTRISANIGADYVDWFHLRAKFLSAVLFHSQSAEELEHMSRNHLVAKLSKITPNVFGIKFSSKSGKLIGFVVWTYDWDTSANKATVLKVHVEPGFDKDPYTVALLAHAKMYLETENRERPETQRMHKLTVWDSETTPSSRQELSQLGAAAAKNLSLGAILMHRTQDQTAIREGDIIWENNSKLPWF